MNLDAPIEVGPEGYSFGPSLAQQKQLQAMADMLRKRDYSAQPEGSMVGNRYVGPSITQRLTPIVGALGSAYAQTQANQGEAALAGRIDRAQRDWQSSLPQTIAAKAQQTAPFMAPGMEGDENIPGTSTITAPATPQVLPSRQSVLQVTMRGLQIPGNEGAAGVWNKGMSDEWTREDAQAARLEERGITAQARKDEQLANLNFKREQLEAEMKNKTNSAEALAVYQKMHDKTLRDIAAMSAGASAKAAETTREDRLKFQKENDIEKLSRRMEPVAPMVAAANMVQNMLDDYYDPDTKRYRKMEGVGMLVGSLPPGVLSVKGAENRQKIQMFANAILRNQAGLSQTLSEQEKAELEIMASGKFRQDQFTKIWPSLMNKINSTTETVRAGYDPTPGGVVDTFIARGGKLNSITSRHKAGAETPTTASKVPVPSGKGALTPAEMAELEQLRKGP